MSRLVMPLIAVAVAGVGIYSWLSVRSRWLLVICAGLIATCCMPKSVSPVLALAPGLVGVVLGFLVLSIGGRRDGRLGDTWVCSGCVCAPHTVHVRDVHPVFHRYCISCGIAFDAQFPADDRAPELPRRDHP